jgi:hypothetical protein
MRTRATVLLAAAGLLAGACRDAPPAQAGLPAAGTTTDSVTIGDPPLIDTAGTAAAAHVRAVPPSAIAARAPSSLRGIYLNAYAAGSTNRLNTLLALADTTEINAFVIDVKDERGIRYRSGIELAMELAQAGEVTIRDLEALASRLRTQGSGPSRASSCSRTPSCRRPGPAGPSDPGRRRVARPRGALVGERLESRGMGLQSGHRGGGRPGGVRRDPVRLRPLPRGVP